ncbi:MAG: hypothetical protein AAF478_08335 [Pseudomonadota bacterium]
MEELSKTGNMGINTKSHGIKNAGGLLPVSVLLFAVLSQSACVSDTLNTQNTQPQPLAETPTYDPAQREQAIAEMRAKGAQPGSGELTSAFVESDGPNQPLTSSEQNSLINELEQGAAQNEANVTDAELAAKQRSIRELQEKARNHYDNAVNSIQN